MTQTTTLAESTAPSRSPARPVLAALGHRWPTWLALGWAALTLSDVGDGTEFAFVLLVAGVGYLAVAVLRRRRATWPLALALFAVVVGLRVAGVNEWAVLLGLGAALAVVGLGTGALREPGPGRLQLPAAVVFTGAGLAAASASPEIGLWITALGLIGHAAWDGYLWWADRVVARSFAEWCGVLDLVLGVGILALVR